MLGKEISSILQDINPMIVKNFYSSHEISIKSDESIVTKTDREVEEILIPRLKELLPSSEIIGEESAPKDPEQIARCFESEYLWAVDPIDGTMNFASGIPNFTVSVGLLKRTENGYEPVSGGISFPAASEVYFTDDEKTICKNIKSGEKTEVKYKKRKSVSSILLPNHLALRLKLDQKNRFIGNLRFMGSTAADLLFVSLGKGSASCTIAHIWDVAAGFAIAKTQNIFPRDLSTGQIKKNFSTDDFLYGEASINWRLKDPLVLCDDYFEDVKALFTE